MANDINLDCGYFDHDVIYHNGETDIIYVCKKRGSIFGSIVDHCYDCSRYEKILDKMLKVLESD